jgi:hypothetical protein
MSHLRVGDVVEAAWQSPSDSGTWKPAAGVIVAADDSAFWYRVRWDSGYEAVFPRTELRLKRRSTSRLEPSEMVLEPEVAG